MNAVKDRCFVFWMIAFIRGVAHAPGNSGYNCFYGVLHSCVP